MHAQISKSLLDEETKSLRLPKFMAEEKDPEQTKQELFDKIAQLNASIDDVAASLKTKEVYRQPLALAGPGQRVLAGPGCMENSSFSLADMQGINGCLFGGSQCCMHAAPRGFSRAVPNISTRHHTPCPTTWNTRVTISRCAISEPEAEPGATPGNDRMADDEMAKLVKELASNPGVRIWPFDDQEDDDYWDADEDELEDDPWLSNPVAEEEAMDNKLDVSPLSPLSLDSPEPVSAYDGIAIIEHGDLLALLAQSPEKAPVLLDIRNSVEFAFEHVEGARNIPVKMLSVETIDDLIQDKDVTVVVISSLDHRSLQACVRLQRVFHLTKLHRCGGAHLGGASRGCLWEHHVFSERTVMHLLYPAASVWGAHLGGPPGGASGSTT
eukprot:gene18835-25381_t